VRSSHRFRNYYRKSTTRISTKITTRISTKITTLRSTKIAPQNPMESAKLPQHASEGGGRGKGASTFPSKRAASQDMSPACQILCGNAARSRSPIHPLPRPVLRRLNFRGSLGRLAERTPGMDGIVIPDALLPRTVRSSGVFFPAKFILLHGAIPNYLSSPLASK